MKNGLVLGGGAARGAYEAGVLAYLRGELAADLGRHVPLDIITGASVGAINACFVAATADAPATQGLRMSDHWRSLKLEEILQFGVRDVVRVLREFFGKAPIRWTGGLTGGLINPRGMEQVVTRGIPWRAIAPHIRKGLVTALSVTATHVGTGKTVVFVQRREGGAPPWSRDPHIVAQTARIGPKHALASAAIPVIFPSAKIRGQLFVDGGLRQSVPLSPALRLGAERVIVISLRHLPTEQELAHERERIAKEEAKFASAPSLIGKTLNALLLDSTDQDLARLNRINAIIDAGVSAYGPSFAETLNSALVPLRNQPVRYVRDIVVRPSQDIGRLAWEYANSPEFRRRASGLAARIICRLADSEAGDDSDIVSLLLFDGGFADQLIQLGHADAKAQRAEWLRFFAEPDDAEEAEPPTTAVG